MASVNIWEEVGCTRARVKHQFPTVVFAAANDVIGVQVTISLSMIIVRA